MNYPHFLRKGLRLAGFDLIRYDYQNHALARLVTLLKDHSINYVIDVGANEGQYARKLREGGYKGRILSIEPTRAAFQKLKARTQFEADWNCLQAAVGEGEGKILINIARNSQSSSILEMMPLHKVSAPGSDYVAQEEVNLTSIDNMLSLSDVASKVVFLKIDAQGYENMILRGAIHTMPSIRGIELEMSLVLLYDGELLFPELNEKLRTFGFTLMSLEPVLFSSVTRQVMQVNGIYFRID